MSYHRSWTEYCQQNFKCLEWLPIVNHPYHTSWMWASEWPKQARHNTNQETHPFRKDHLLIDNTRLAGGSAWPCFCDATTTEVLVLDSAGLHVDDTQVVIPEDKLSHGSWTSRERRGDEGSNTYSVHVPEKYAQYTQIPSVYEGFVKVDRV